MIPRGTFVFSSMEPEDLLRQVRRLRRLVALQGAALALAALGPFGASVLRGLGEPPLKLRRDGNMVRLSTSSDGPFVVSHLVFYGGSESQKITAALTPPIAVADSHGAEISLKGLVWLDIWGQRADPPPTGCRLIALYVRPERTEDAPR